MKLLYFAWVRERTGRAAEELALPAEVTTVGELIDWLKGRGPEYEFAFQDAKSIRAALDRTHVRHDARLAGAHEVAFFPPMTGG